MQIETFAPNSFGTRKTVILSVTALLVIVGVVAVSTSHASNGEAASTELATTCQTSSMMIISKDNAFRLSSDKDPSFNINPSFVASSDSNQPKWTFKKVSGSTDTFTIMSKSTGNYLYAPSTGTSNLKMTSTASPTSAGEWKLTDQGCSASGNYYYFKNVGRSKYMSSGFSYPGLTDSATSKFYVTSTGGAPLCTDSAASKCDKQCKTGTLVAWYNECTGSDCVKTSSQQSTENTAQKTCNTRCKACGVWDTNCKACGGTIDKTGSPQKVSGSGSSSSGYRYYRQCDCNSALKAAGLSLAAVFAVYFNFKFQAQ